MQRNDIMQTRNYTLLAHAQCSGGGNPHEGTIKLLGNDSSHFFVVAADGVDAERARVLHVIDYSTQPDDDGIVSVYHVALQCMVDSAMRL